MLAALSCVAHDTPKGTLATKPPDSCAGASEESPRVESGNTEFLSSDTTPVCSLEFRPTGVVVKGGSGDSLPDPGAMLVRASDGAMFSDSPEFRGGIVRWTSAGQFERAAGRQGHGPGEFPAIGMQLLIGPHDTLFIRGNGLWTLMSPDLDFIESAASKVTATRPATVILDDGTIVSSRSDAGDRDHEFHSFNVRTKSATDFGDRNSARSSSYRLLSEAGGDRFWAGPRTATSGRYTLELWDLAGDRLRSITREAPWLRPGPEGAPPPRLSVLHADEFGRILTISVVPSSRWKAVKDPRDRAAQQPKMFDAYVELLDGSSGALLASVGPIRGDSLQRSIPARFFRRSVDGYITGQTDEGFYTSTLYSYSLVPSKK
jgi:hypothetical protein